MSNFLYPSNSKICEKEPRYNEQILSVPWSSVKSRFHCIIVSLWAWYLFWWDSQFIQLPLSEAPDLSSASVSVMLKVQQLYMENHVVLHFALSVFLCLSWCKQGSLSTETYQSVSPTNIEWSTRLILFFNILSVIIHQPTVLQKYRNSTDPESKKQVYKLIYCILFNSLVPAVGSATTTVPITVPFSHEK